MKVSSNFLNVLLLLLELRKDEFSVLLFSMNLSTNLLGAEKYIERSVDDNTLSVYENITLVVINFKSSQISAVNDTFDITY